MCSSDAYFVSLQFVDFFLGFLHALFFQKPDFLSRTAEPEVKFSWAFQSENVPVFPSTVSVEFVWAARSCTALGIFCCNTKW